MRDEVHLSIPTPPWCTVARPGYWSGNWQRWWATTSHWFWRGIWIESGQDRVEHWVMKDEISDFFAVVCLTERLTKMEGCFFFTDYLKHSSLEVFHFFCNPSPWNFFGFRSLRVFFFQFDLFWWIFCWNTWILPVNLLPFTSPLMSLFPKCIFFCICGTSCNQILWANRNAKKTKGLMFEKEGKQP